MVPDAAFGLSLRERATAQGAHVPMPGALRVAVSVREWPYFARKPTSAGMADYRAAVASAIVALVRHYCADVVFLSTCQGVSAYWTDDSSVASAIWSSLPDDVQACVTVDSSFHDPVASRRNARAIRLHDRNADARGHSVASRRNACAAYRVRV